MPTLATDVLAFASSRRHRLERLTRLALIGFGVWLATQSRP
jgi:hypothetical protein